MPAPLARLLQRLAPLALSLLVALTTLIVAADGALAARDNNTYDGNIYALYAGNGSLVPPRSTLAQAMADHRPIVLGYFLDDSAASKQYAVVFNELQRLWGRTAELILLTTDPLQDRKGQGPTDPATYWTGVIPQVVVFDTDGQPVLNESGPVSIDAINAALTKVTGLKPQGDVTLSLSRDVNELNSEIVPSR
ncbi:MAG: thylakoid membrane photosystem I accumulation factor [Vulcanococcus sp.]